MWTRVGNGAHPTPKRDGDVTNGRFFGAFRRLEGVGHVRDVLFQRCGVRKGEGRKARGRDATARGEGTERAADKSERDVTFTKRRRHAVSRGAMGARSLEK